MLASLSPGETIHRYAGQVLIRRIIQHIRRSGSAWRVHVFCLESRWFGEYRLARLLWHKH